MKTEHTRTVGYLPALFVLFYLVSLALWKGWFVLRNAPGEGVDPWAEGFWLDLSMACGAYLVVFVPLVLTGFGRLPFLKWAIYPLTFLTWIVFCTVEFASVLMYKEWGAPLDARAISYLRHPGEAWASTHAFVGMTDVFLFLGITVAGIFFFMQLIRKYSAPPVTRATWIWLFFSGPLAFLGLRGGWQKLPIVPSDAFYSSNMAANFAATNKVWYLAYTLTHSAENERYHTRQEIQAFASTYLSDSPNIFPTDSTNWRHKNIVLLVMEGWSASAVNYTGGKEGTTPFFDSLAHVSQRYTRAYSSGFRTDQGLMSLLCGMPSIHSLNMPNMLHKVNQYPSLPQKMEAQGRQTAFFYGGNLNFSNLYQYLTTLGFDKITSRESFADSLHQSEWGVPDHILLDYVAGTLKQLPQPFFSTILLLSSHAPFDIPGSLKGASGTSTAQQYLASVNYSDASLRQFFNIIKRDSLFENTVFILVSDHGTTHLGADVASEERFHIPFIVYDPSHAAEYKGRTIDIPCNHFDIPATICANIGVSQAGFPFSRNLNQQNPSRRAYWNTDQVAASINSKDVDIVTLTKSGTQLKGKDPVLFLDWVKDYFSADRPEPK